MLSSKGKVFLQGIAGIGKSELIKAYAEKFKKEYTKIIYFTYSGNLTKDIANLDFADDINSNESVKNRFSRHNNFLRRLKEDSLIIVDNFNTTAGKDEALDVVMGYSCRIVFTTRCRFDDFFTMTLTEINNTDDLISMMGYFYSDADENRQCLEQIILAVHRHTFAVEFSALLLKIGLLGPNELLNCHDSIIQVTNYAVLLCDIGKPELGLSALRKLSRTVNDTSSDESTDYAVIQEAMGGIYLVIGNIANATSHFKKALAVYEKIFGAETEFTLDKKQEILDMYVQAGINIRKQLLSE